MAECPKCKLEIKELEVAQNALFYGMYDKDDAEEEAERETERDLPLNGPCWSNYLFSCPECHEELFYSIKDARAFLLKPYISGMDKFYGPERILT